VLVGLGCATQRIIIAITGASGAIYGIRALQLLRGAEQVECHLVVTPGGRTTILAETSYSLGDVYELADVVHKPGDLGASISSGSFPVKGMLVAPCSIKTLSAIANSYDSNLVVRAADVTLKERRRLVLMVRETPLHHTHLRLMSEATLAGAIIAPPVPSFYNRPQSLDDVVTQTVARSLDLLGVPVVETFRWMGSRAAMEFDHDVV
jgi:4-hydroxy-3-polyprenylbenzoate decarboxylase